MGRLFGALKFEHGNGARAMTGAYLRLTPLIPLERQIQESFVDWCRLSEHRYPELRLAFAVPNGGKRDIVTGAQLKAQGVRRGVLDWCLPVARQGFHSLWIEFKRPGEYLTPDQEEYRRLLAVEGSYAAVCTNPESAIDRVRWYLETRKPKPTDGDDVDS